MQILLPKISDWQCCQQLLESMHSGLLNKVRAQINEDMSWNEIVKICEIHDSIQHKFRTGNSNQKPKHTPKVRQHQTPTQTTSSNTSSPFPHSKSSSSKKAQASSKPFKKLTDKERAELAKIGACFYCRKPGHQAQNCPNKKQQIQSAAGTIQQDGRQSEVIHPPKTVSAAQHVKLRPDEEPNLNTKGKSVQPVLDSAKEHLLVTTKINGQSAKTLVH